MHLSTMLCGALLCLIMMCCPTLAASSRASSYHIPNSRVAVGPNGCNVACGSAIQGATTFPVGEAHDAADLASTPETGSAFDIALDADQRPCGCGFNASDAQFFQATDFGFLQEPELAFNTSSRFQAEACLYIHSGSLTLHLFSDAAIVNSTKSPGGPIYWCHKFQEQLTLRQVVNSTFGFRVRYLSSKVNLQFAWTRARIHYTSSANQTAVPPVGALCDFRNVTSCSIRQKSSMICAWSFLSPPADLTADLPVRDASGNGVDLFYWRSSSASLQQSPSSQHYYTREGLLLDNFVASSSEVALVSNISAVSSMALTSRVTAAKALTFEFWVRPLQCTSGAGRYFQLSAGEGTTCSTSDLLMMVGSVADGSAYYRFNNAGANCNADPVFHLYTYGELQHIAVVFEPKLERAQVYKNGALRYSAYMPGATAAVFQDGPVQVQLADAVTSSLVLPGDSDRRCRAVYHWAALYDEAMSPERIQTLFAEGHRIAENNGASSAPTAAPAPTLAPGIGVARRTAWHRISSAAMDPLRQSSGCSWNASCCTPPVGCSGGCGSSAPGAWVSLDQLLVNGQASQRHCACGKHASAPYLYVRGLDFAVEAPLLSAPSVSDMRLEVCLLVTKGAVSIQLHDGEADVGAPFLASKGHNCTGGLGPLTLSQLTSPYFGVKMRYYPDGNSCSLSLGDLRFRVLYHTATGAPTPAPVAGSRGNLLAGWSFARPKDGGPMQDLSGNGNQLFYYQLSEGPVLGAALQREHQWICERRLLIDNDVSLSGDQAALLTNISAPSSAALSSSLASSSTGLSFEIWATFLKFTIGPSRIMQVSSAGGTSCAPGDISWMFGGYPDPTGSAPEATAILRVINDECIRLPLYGFLHIGRLQHIVVSMDFVNRRVFFYSDGKLSAEFYVPNLGPLATAVPSMVAFGNAVSSGLGVSTTLPRSTQFIVDFSAIHQEALSAANVAALFSAGPEIPGAPGGATAAPTAAAPQGLGVADAAPVSFFSGKRDVDPLHRANHSWSGGGAGAGAQQLTKSSAEPSRYLFRDLRLEVPTGVSDIQLHVCLTVTSGDALLQLLHPTLCAHLGAPVVTGVAAGPQCYLLGPLLTPQQAHSAHLAVSVSHSSASALPLSFSDVRFQLSFNRAPVTAATLEYPCHFLGATGCSIRNRTDLLFAYNFERSAANPLADVSGNGLHLAYWNSVNRSLDSVPHSRHQWAAPLGGIRLDNDPAAPLPAVALLTTDASETVLADLYSRLAEASALTFEIWAEVELDDLDSSDMAIFQISADQGTTCAKSSQQFLFGGVGLNHVHRFGLGTTTSGCASDSGDAYSPPLLQRQLAHYVMVADPESRTFTSYLNGTLYRSVIVPNLRRFSGDTVTGHLQFGAAVSDTLQLWSAPSRVSVFFCAMHRARLSGAQAAALHAEGPWISEAPAAQSLGNVTGNQVIVGNLVVQLGLILQPNATLEVQGSAVVPGLTVTAGGATPLTVSGTLVLSGQLLLQNACRNGTSVVAVAGAFQGSFEGVSSSCDSLRSCETSAPAQLLYSQGALSVLTSIDSSACVDEGALPPGALAGIVAGGVVALLLVALVLPLGCHLRKRNADVQAKLDRAGRATQMTQL